MIVSQLIEYLRKMPQDAEVFHIWDGAARTGIEHVFVSKSGNVMTSDNNQVVYADEDRPLDAPSEKEEPYWYTNEIPLADRGL